VDIKSLKSLQFKEARLSLGVLRQHKRLAKLKKLTLGGIRHEDLKRLHAELPGVEVK
jgi:hypothetical protein